MTKNGISAKLLLSALCFTLSSTAGVANAKPKESVLRFRLGFEPSTLDWNVGDVVPILVIRNVMRGLYRWDDSGKLLPDLVQQASVTNGGKTWRFQLHSNIRWSDGQPLTAEHAAASLKRALEPATASTYAYFLYDIEGAEDFNRGKTKELSAVRVLSPNTFEVRLQRAASYFPAILTHWITYPIRPDLMARYRDYWSNPEHLATLGSFRVSEWKPNRRVVMVPNPYAVPQPWLKKVEGLVITDDATALNLFQSKRLEVMTDPGQGAEKSGNSIHRNSAILYFIGLSPGHPLSSTRQGILALSAALNRNEIPLALNAPHRPTLGFCPPELLAMVGLKDRQLVQQSPSLGLAGSPKRARELLREAGFAEGKNVPPLTLRYFNRPSIRELAEWIQGQWKTNLGLDVRLEGQDPKTYWTELAHNPVPFFINSKGASYPDPDVFFRLFESRSLQNYGHWNDSSFDQSVTRARTQNVSARREAYRKASDTLLNQKPGLIPLYFRDTNYLVQPYVKGLQIDLLTNIGFSEVTYE